MTRNPRPLRLAAAVAVAAVLGAAACTGGDDELVIGVVGPLTGPLAAVGEQQVRGAELAASVLNRDGGIGGRRIRIASRDSADAARTVAMLRDLASREGAVAIIGPETATPVLGEGNPAAQAGIPVFLTHASVGAVDPPAVRNVFRLIPSAADQAVVLARWLAVERAITRVAVARTAGAEGRAAADLLAAALAGHDAELVATREIVPGDVDQTPAVRDLRGSGAEALVVWAAPADAARVAIAVERLAWGVQIAGPMSLFLADYRALAGDASDGTAIVLPFRRDWFSARMASWILGYHTRFGIVTLPDQRTLIPDLPVVSMAAYDAVHLAAAAVRRAGPGADAMVRALREMDEHEGILRTYRFGPDRGEAYEADDLWMARFFNFAVVYDIDARHDREEQIAFYKIQVSAYYVPDAFFDTERGAELSERILEDVLANPEEIDFFRPYTPPRPPPGRI